MRSPILAYCLVFVLGLFPHLLRANVFEIKEVSLLKVDSAITPATFDYVEHQLSKAPEDALIVISLNTPGGLVSTTKDLVTLLGKEKRPVVVWVTPAGASAASAGAIIAAAAHFIVMSPGTNMGAATPVGLTEDIKESDGRSKLINDLTALVRSLSQMRGRASEPFEKMIKSAESYTDQEALRLGVSIGTASSEKELLTLLSGKNFQSKGVSYAIRTSAGPRLQDYDPTLGQSLLEVLANPSTAFVLFITGLILIYFEFQAPGGFVAGGIGLGLLLLAGIAFQVLPLDWGALGLIAVGVVLLVLELFITSYGILGLAGLVTFVLGSLFLFHGEDGLISVEYSVLYSTLAGAFVGIGLLTWYLLREKKLVPEQGHFFLPVNHEGIVLKVLTEARTNKVYQVKVRGEIWRSESQEIFSVGEKVLVRDIDHKQLLAHIEKLNTEE